MSEQDGAELEYDSFDLTNISQRNGFQLPPPRKRENLNDFLSNLTMKDTIPKQDVRKIWLRKTEERDKALRQLRDAKSKIEYWMAKARTADEMVAKCDEDLQKLDALIMADILANR